MMICNLSDSLLCITQVTIQCTSDAPSCTARCEPVSSIFVFVLGLGFAVGAMRIHSSLHWIIVRTPLGPTLMFVMCGFRVRLLFYCLFCFLQHSR